MSKVQSIRKFNIVIVTLVLIINTVSTHSQSLIENEAYYTHNIGDERAVTTSSISDSIYPNDDNHKIIRPIALKTNLLFDVATIINIEAEVPLSKKVSVAAEWMFPWWLSNSHQRSLQLMGAMWN